MAFTGEPVVVISDPGDIEIKNYVDTLMGAANPGDPLQFDRETYTSGTMQIKFTAGAGAGTFVLTWKESNDTGAIGSADYVDVTTERFGGAISETATGDWLYSVDLTQISVAKYVEVQPVVTNASNNSSMTVIIRLRR